MPLNSDCLGSSGNGNGNVFMTKLKKKRKWLRTIGMVLLILLALLGLFHRPIVFEGTRYFVVRAAKQQNLDVDYTISGSIFSTLTISNLRATPTEPGPIQRLEVGKLHLQYSLWGAIRNGLPALLKIVDARNVFIELTPAAAPPPEKQAEPQALKFPALFPELLNLENVNLLVHQADGDLVVSNLIVNLLPDREGQLKLERVRIPGLREWTDLTAQTTFRNRNLILTGLTLEPGIFLREFNLDASQLSDAILGVELTGTLFQAETTLTATVSDLNASNDARLDIQLSGLQFDAVWKFLNRPPPAHGELTDLTASFAGKLEYPAGWWARADVSMSGLQVQDMALGETRLAIRMANGIAALTVLQSMENGNRVSSNASLTLPDTIHGFGQSPANGEFNVSLPDLPSLTKQTQQPLTGSAQVIGSWHLADGAIRANILIDSTTLAMEGVQASDTHVEIHAEKLLSTPEGTPVFQGLTTKVNARMASLRVQDYEVENVVLNTTSKENSAVLDELSFRKGGNSVQARGDTLLPADLKSFATQPMQVTLSIQAPELGAFLASEADSSLEGSLQVQADLDSNNGNQSGQIQISGEGIAFDGLHIRTINGTVEITNNSARIGDFAVIMDDENSIQVRGAVQLAEPFSYEGKVDILLRDLSKFQPTLTSLGISETVAGSLIVNWVGQGNASQIQQSGTLGLALSGGRYGDISPITANASADYSPDFINLRDLRLSAGSIGEAALSAFWQNNRLRISNLSARQKRLVLLAGSLELPLVLAEAGNLDRMIPDDQPVNISLRVPELSLRTLFDQLGENPAPATGRIAATFEASGPLSDLQANLSFRGENLRAAAAGNLDPAQVIFRSQLNAGSLSFNGTVQQRLIQPLAITGSVPIDLPRLKRSGTIDPSTPLDLRVRLPESTLASLNRLVPAVRQSRGTASADVRVAGTIEKPRVEGSLTASVNAMRFTDPTFPPLDGVAVRLNFRGNRMEIAELRGRLAGGDFEVGGAMNFADTANPELDFRIASRNALLLQNDDLTVRVSSDVRIQGPLNAGTVSGDVFVTKSRFFKDIDILPIGLPGRPAPQPPAEPEVVSFPDPPLRNWTFDVRIRTLDPFLIQSNLANGRITMDLHLRGTGLEPWMDGSVRIEQLTASLPFSRLQIESGIIYFTPDSPFVPRLNLRGTSTIRDYDVSVYIYGPVTAPEAVFSSDPPLPQSEIVSLIATGTTTTELARDPNALAGRGAVLLFQELYRRVFRRNQPPPQNDSFLSRIQFDIGTTDPKTGQQSASARVPFTDQIVLVGGLDVGGNFRGQVKYLLRFK